MFSAITRAITLSTSGAPPTEFRIFSAGINSSQKGDFLFDAQAARQVLAAYKQGGVDLPIDLEHLSLSAGSSPRVDSHDARGWFQLALRNGELWAFNCKWTPDGARRLAERTQRYISPAFATDGDRPTQLVNCALVAHPATHGAPALVAASKNIVVGVRVSPATRAALYLLSAKRGTTISAVVLSALATINDSGNTAPTRDQLATLNAVCSALGISADSDATTIKDALSAVLEAAAPPEPSNADPLAATAEPAPQPNAYFAKLSRDVAARGLTLAQFEAKKAAMPRSPSKKAK